MKELGKVSSKLIFKIWRNLLSCLFGTIVIILLSVLLPYYLSPVWGLICAVIVYTFIYDNKGKKDSTCLLIPFAFLYTFVGYSFTVILLNILYVWGVNGIPNELIFFSKPPFLGSLILDPIAFIVMGYTTLRFRRLSVCIECRRINGELFERGAQGQILTHETYLQLKNLTTIFGLLSLAVWVYFLVAYVNINLNERDMYVFAKSAVIVLGLDMLYFTIRYYNLYLDLKENDELTTPSDLNSRGGKTYLRYYVICDDQVYVDPCAIDVQSPWKEVIDTPFFTKRSVNGINITEIKKTIQKMTGKPGELKFFYGRKLGEDTNNRMLRYFYFLDSIDENAPELTTEGEWMDFEKIKYLYSNNPGRLGDIMVKDITRLATIILTEKVFNEKGYRKSRIKMYNPTFDLSDVRKSNLDFQDDKWIDISLFNSDTPFYGIKRWIRKRLGSKRAKNKNSLS